jgi:hypothetical protein
MYIRSSYEYTQYTAHIWPKDLIAEPDFDVYIACVSNYTMLAEPCLFVHQTKPTFHSTVTWIMV